MTQNYRIGAHCGGPAYAYEGATIYECANCLTRWCEQCELVRKDNRYCLFCGKNPVDCGNNTTR